AWGASASVSVPLVGVPPGGVTVAMLVRVPVAVGLTWAVKAKVTVALTGRLMVAARAPMPLVGPVTLPPPLRVVSSREGAVRPVGRGSDRAAPVASLGPALLTTMV